MGKKANKKSEKYFQNNEESNQQIQDPQAWGSSKRNYYQDGDQQYSSVSEEEQQAKRIYDSQHKLLNDPTYYQTAHLEKTDNLQQDSDEQNHKEHSLISSQYLLGQIQWALRCQADSDKINDSAVNEKVKNLYKKLIDMYLIIAITLKEFKIPYVEHHPLVQELSNVKTYLLKVRKRVNTCQKNHKPKSITKYQQLKKQQLTDKLNKKNKKEQKSQDNNSSTDVQSGKRVAFETIKQNQGRLASELMLKNKGLIKKRKKTDGNSRLKLRKRFAKAQSKQRAIGHFIRENPGRQYEGQTNIRYGKIGSIKLK